MTEAYERLDHLPGDGEAQPRRPKWVAWLVGGSIVILVLIGMTIVGVFTLMSIAEEPHMEPARVTNPSIVSNLREGREEYEHELTSELSSECAPINDDRAETDLSAPMTPVGPSLDCS